ncbi:MAG: acyl--CoA ligase [Rickettsiales bacterium]|jgi:long-chain acyl-CoA synthetase|nr:acyl--CoA ligase [Rickettsiales bacterium]
MIKNIYEVLAGACQSNAANTFFVRPQKTYAQLLGMVQKRAVKLAKKYGVKKGDTVALLSGTSAEFLVSYFAILSQGARALMLDTGLSKAEHESMMKIAECKLALAQKSYFIEGSETKMADIEEPDSESESEFRAADVVREDIAQISFTSGTTGVPKIVPLTHGNLVSLAEGALIYGAVIKPGFMFYGFLPLYHIYGVVINIIAPIVLKCSLLIQPVLNPKEFLKDFAEYKPHVIPAVPRIWEGFYKKIISSAKEKKKYTIMRVVLAAQGFLKLVGLGSLVKKVKAPVHEIFGGRVRLLVSAGATLKPSVRKFFERLDFVVGDCYGLTETTGPGNFNFKFKMEDGRTNWAGPLPGNKIKIHNPDKSGVGEIWIKGSLVMKGYLNNPAANAESFEDGWFKSGDLGVIDSKGRLTVKGRRKQIIVLDSGKNVYPDELEDLYLQNDDILAAAVFERVINGKTVAYAVFQVAPGTTLAKVSQLIKVSNLMIAPYKWVSHFAITEDELPQTSAKKIKHFEIKKMLDAGAFPLREE